MSRTTTKNAFWKSKYQKENAGPSKTTVKCEQCGNDLKLHFPYNKEVIEMIKSIPNRKYIPDEKLWVVPIKEQRHVLNARIWVLKILLYFID